jgi:hypothetical protein
MSSSNNRLRAGRRRRRVRHHVSDLCPLCQQRPGAVEGGFGDGRDEIEFRMCEVCAGLARAAPGRWLELCRRAFPRPGRG